MFKNKFGKTILDLSTEFPFHPPKIIIEFEEEQKYFCLYDFQKLKFHDIMNEQWHPSLKLADIAERVAEFLEKHLTPND